LAAWLLSTGYIFGSKSAESVSVQVSDDSRTYKSLVGGASSQNSNSSKWEVDWLLLIGREAKMGTKFIFLQQGVEICCAAAFTTLKGILLPEKLSE
jgi:hypothetical protein